MIEPDMNDLAYNRAVADAAEGYAFLRSRTESVAAAAHASGVVRRILRVSSMCNGSPSSTPDSRCIANGCSRTQQPGIEE